MPKFRKKPIVVEAEQFFLAKKPWPAGVVDFWPPERPEDSDEPEDVVYGPPQVHTLEGPLIVSDGDWIITGVKGERYPCKPDVFEATYEAVESVVKRDDTRPETQRRFWTVKFIGG